MNHQNLVDLIKQSNWNTIQFQISRFLDISILLYSDAGKQITCNENKQNICSLFCNDNAYDINCCINGLESRLRNKAISYFKCRANLHMFSFAIEIDNTSILIIGGKVYHSLSEFYAMLKTVSAMNLSEKKIALMSQTVNIESVKKLQEAAEFTKEMSQVLSSTYYQQFYKTKCTQVISMMNISSSLVDSKKNEDLFTTTLENIIQLLDISTTSIMLLDTKQNRFVTYISIGRHKARIGRLSIENNDRLIKKLQQNQKNFISYTFTDPTLPKEEPEDGTSGASKPVDSSFLFPINKKDRLIGFLAIFPDSMSIPLTTEELSTISFLSLQLSILIENRSFSNHISLYTKNINRFLETVKSFEGSIATEEPFSTVLAIIAEYAQAEQGSIVMFDNKTCKLTVKAIRGIKRVDYDRIKPVQIVPGEGISGKVFLNGKGIVVADVEEDERFERSARARYKTNSFISIPLITQNKVIGILNLSDKKDGKPFNNNDLAVLDSLTSYAALAIERFSFKIQSEELKKISISDSLTKLANRHFLQERLVAEIERSKRHTYPMSLIILDIDDFKVINDSFGHSSGDEALVRIAEIILAATRTEDIPARYGGEEFAILLPQTSKIQAENIADRVCKSISSSKIEVTDRSLSLSASIGLATFPDDAESIEMLIKNADIALYVAKSTGKNRVVLYEKI